LWFESIEKQGKKLQDANAEVLKPTGLSFVVAGHASMLMFWLAEKAPNEYRE